MWGPLLRIARLGPVGRLFPFTLSRVHLAVTLGLVGLSILTTTVFSIVLGYRAELRDEGKQLTELVRAHAAGVNTLLDHPAVLFEPGSTAPAGTTTVVQRALLFRGGSQGEVVFTRLIGDSVAFWAPGAPTPAPVTLGDPRGGPGQAAARGESGVMIALDHSRRRVLAAYQPLATPGYGIVAKIELRAIRAPYLRAGLKALVIALLFSMAALTGLFVLLRRPAHAWGTALRQLRESEARFRRLADRAPDIIYRVMLKPHPHFEYVSSAVERTLGFTPEDHYRNPHLGLELVHPDDRHLLTTDRADPVTGVMPPVVIRFRHRDGHWVRIEQHNIAVRNGGNDWVAVEGIGRDITGEREAQEEIAKLGQVVTQTSEVVIITDPHGVIEYVNPAFTDVTGYTLDEVRGHTPRILKSGRQLPEVYEDLWRTIHGGRSWAGRFFNRRKDGTEYLADVVISPVRGSDGRVVNLVGQQRDITHQRETEEQLRQAQKMEVVGQLSGGIAHDFNNILTIILANTALLRGDPATDSPEAGDIREAATRGAALVKRLLAVSRNEALHLEPVDLAEAMRSIASALRRILPETIEVSTDVPDLPQVMADRAAIDQMILNLATNARDAMPNGGRLTFSALIPRDTDEPLVELRVTDTGTGIPREQLPHVFEPFFTTKPPGAGTGLGLAMVYGIMQEHHGSVLIESEAGVGTSVRLRFPPAVARRPATIAPAAAPHTGGSGELVLLVEDEPSLASVGKRIIERLGYRVDVAENGNVGLALLQAGRPYAVVVSDVVMPSMSGPELLRRARALGLLGPFIFTTGYAAQEVLGGLRAMAGVSFLMKPWTVDEMAHALLDARAHEGAATTH